MQDNLVRLAELGLTMGSIPRIVFTDKMWIEFNCTCRKTHQGLKERILLKEQRQKIVMQLLFSLCFGVQ